MMVKIKYNLKITFMNEYHSSMKISTSFPNSRLSYTQLCPRMRLQRGKTKILIFMDFFILKAINVKQMI